MAEGKDPFLWTFSGAGRGGPPTGGPYLCGEYFGVPATVPDPERFTLADCASSRSLVDLACPSVQR